MSRHAISTFEAGVGPALELLGSVPLLADLTDAELAGLAGAAIPFEIDAGRTLFEQGEPAEELYVLERGSVALSVRLPGESVIELGVLGAGGVVGEMGVLDDEPRSATARAVERTAGFRLPRAAFQMLWAVQRPGTCAFLRRLLVLLAARLRATTERMVGEEEGPVVPGLAARRVRPEADAPERMRPRWPVERLLGLPFFRGFRRTEAEALLASMTELHVPKHQVIFREGDAPGSFYIVVRGAVQVSVERDGMVRKLAILPPGSVFGELALFRDDRRSATCLARERSILLELEAPAFERMLAAESDTAFRFMRSLTHLLTRSLRAADRRHAWLVARGRHLATMQEGG